ncbi:hypothetical protein GUITHDRAFT_120997 [Guillardia theta CCMP2712]|uniref:Uncharacterized protein n=2 Tax=Guillardia theta TaxID=55529 RepID=L1IAG0_GUITC|nr:hypothetical protein GUITHDRAFT_120997 [Guillardia theta CCMP2712]EKX32805.1 hypothetical protein GUITHDRAFT_120997 [Guillardia theta CCMP2712]|eukprot:XP_005819785.1 hypothetical protein GUITHDRAFT_120997 [Guillardia theta CCMP2712]
MSFKGLPGQDGFKRLVMIVTAMMGIPASKLFGTCKDKRNLYRDATDALNGDPLFAGALKSNTTRDKWHNTMTIVDSIIDGGEEQFIKRAQNGGNAMNELDKLYLEIARIKRPFVQRAADAKAKKNAEKQDSTERLQCVMKTVEKRTNASFDFTTAVDDVMDEIRPVDGSSTSSPASQSGVQQQLNANEPEGSPENAPDEPSSSLGRGHNKGSQKRAKYNPGLHLDRKKEEDKLTDSFYNVIDALHKTTGEMTRSNAQEQDQQERKERIRMLEAERELEQQKTRTIEAEKDLEKQRTCKLEAHKDLEKQRSATFQQQLEVLKMMALCADKGMPVPPNLMTMPTTGDTSNEML